MSNWPKSKDQLLAAGYEIDNWEEKPCRSCGEPVIWTVTPNGKKMPLEEIGDRQFISHFAACPDAGKWRSKR